MRYELRLTAYDCLEDVVVVGTLLATAQGPDRPSEPLLQWRVQFQGTGQSNPAEWTIDTLSAAIEAIP